MIHSSAVTLDMFEDVFDLVNSTQSVLLLSPLECLWMHDRADLVWYTSFVSGALIMLSI